MKSQVCSALLIICFIFLVTISLSVDAKTCKPSGKLRGKKPSPGQCNPINDSKCCEEGKLYNTYKFSPPVSSHTKANLTLNCFEEHCDCGAQSECDGKYHSDNDPIVALSTGWYNKGSRCHRYINIHGNGRSVKAMVVVACDSTVGCDADDDYQPSCDNDIVDASRAVWEASGVPKKDRGLMEIYWSDA